MNTQKHSIRSGKYRHYKGKDYEVLGVARHSETEEQMVVYRCLYGDYSLWVRPLTMFRDGYTTVLTTAIISCTLPRFS